jgi:ferredoxin
LIHIDHDDIRSIPEFLGEINSCGGCKKCILGCPGLAITLLDNRHEADHPIVSIPYEFSRETIQSGQSVTVLNTQGMELGQAEVANVLSMRNNDRTLVVQIRSPAGIAEKIAGIRVQPEQVTAPLDPYIPHIDDDTIACRCERVTASEIRVLIRQGYRDINEIKAISRAGMGACGAKTCQSLILRLFREEGVPLDQVTIGTRRPFFVEVPLGTFAGVEETK